MFGVAEKYTRIKQCVPWIQVNARGSSRLKRTIEISGGLRTEQQEQAREKIAELEIHKGSIDWTNFIPIYSYRNYTIDWQIFILHHGLIIKFLNPGFVWSVFIILPNSWKNINKYLCQIRSQLCRILLKGLSKSTAASKPKMALFSYGQVEISLEYHNA
jgi:hypothetical protein